MSDHIQVLNKHASAGSMTVQPTVDEPSFAGVKKKPMGIARSAVDHRESGTGSSTVAERACSTKKSEGL